MDQWSGIFQFPSESKECAACDIDFGRLRDLSSIDSKERSGAYNDFFSATMVVERPRSVGVCRTDLRGSSSQWDLMKT